MTLACVGVKEATKLDTVHALTTETHSMEGKIIESLKPNQNSYHRLNIYPETILLVPIRIQFPFLDHGTRARLQTSILKFPVLVIKNV